MLISIGNSDEKIACRATYGADQTVEHLADPIGQDVFDLLDRAFESPGRAQQLGDALFKWLFGPKNARTPLHQGIDERLYFFFDHDDGLNKDRLSRIASLPWELLNDEAGGYIARDPDRGVFRVGSPSPAPMTPSDDPPGPVWPMRIVAASGYEDNSTGFGSAEIKEQIAALRQVFVPWGRSVDIEIIENTTNAQLSTAIESDCPTVLHFCGHARHLADAPPSLVTVLSQGHSDEFSVNQIGDLMSPPIKLVVLSACRSAAAAGTNTEAIWQQSLARVFLANGSKAVIAMQADIQAKAATELVAQFYRECLKGSSIERSVSVARKAIGIADPAWAIPSLTLACMPPAAGYLLFDALRVVKKIVPFGPPDGHSPRFTANFHTQRRALFNWASRRVLAEQYPAPVVLLTGDTNSGKSHFMQWALSNIAHLEQRIRYIDFTTFAATQQSLVHLLRAVRDGSHVRNANGSIACDPALSDPFDTFDAFNADLNALLAGQTPPSPPDTGTIVSDAYQEGSTSSLAPIGGRPFHDFIADRFLVALRQSAVLKPVCIAMDIRPTTFEVTEFAPFLQYVVLPELARWKAAPANTPTIRFVFCCQSDSSARLLEPLFRWFRDEIGPNDRPQEIPFRSDPAADDLSRYFHEMYWFNGEAAITQASNLILSNASRPLDMGLCCTLTDVMKTINIWKDVARNVGEMQ